MIQDKKIAVIIPCYKAAMHIAQVIQTLPATLDHILIIDDACPERSGQVAKEYLDHRGEIIRHGKNQGVGGAMITGYERALALEADIIIKMDGDDQMDSHYLPTLIEPLLNGEATYTKGNRFYDLEKLKEMPKSRLFGNSFLSFLVKLVSGYWNLMDPTNGYTAITRETLAQLPLRRIAKRYFFETDMLIHLNIYRQVVKDIPIPARYLNEHSNLRIWSIIKDFPPKLIKGLMRRIFYRYYLYDFNMASIYLLLALPLLTFGTGFGTYHWIFGSLQDTLNSAGTVMLSALPIILGMQFLLQAIDIDIRSVPTNK